MAYTYNLNTHYSVGKQAKLSSALIDLFVSNIAHSLKGQVDPVTDFTGILSINKVIVQFNRF